LIAQTNPPLASSGVSQSSSPLLPVEANQQQQQQQTSVTPPPMLPPRRVSASASPWSGNGNDVIVTSRDITESPTPLTPLLVRSNRIGGGVAAGSGAGRSSTPLMSERLPSQPPPLPPHADADAELFELHQQSHVVQQQHQADYVDIIEDDINYLRISHHNQQDNNDDNADFERDAADKDTFYEDSTPSYFIKVQLDSSNAARSAPCGLSTKPFLDSSQRSAGLEIQGISAGCSVAKDGRLQLGDRILEINGNSLLGVSFQHPAPAQRCRQSAAAESADSNRVRQAAPPPPVLPKPTAAAAAAAASAPRNLDELARAHSQSILMRDQPSQLPPPPPPPPPPPRHSQGSGDVVNNVEVSSDGVGATVAPSASATTVSGLNAQNVRTLGHVFSVDLIKSTDGLGFSVTARDNAVAAGDNPIFVKTILAKGSAIRDGRLKAGDRLLEIDGNKLTGKTQADVVSLLRSVPTGATVRLVLSRQGSAPPASDAPKSAAPTAAAAEESARTLETSKTAGGDSGVGADGTTMGPTADNSESRTLVFDIPLNDSASAGLGVSVKGHTRDREDSGVFIKNVMKGGAAQKDGRLRENDRLLSVNGTSLAGVDNDAAMAALRQAIKDSSDLGYVRLVIARRPQQQQQQPRFTGNPDFSSDSSAQPPSLALHPAALGAREGRNQPRLPGFSTSSSSNQPWSADLANNAADFISSGPQPPPVPARPFALLPNKPAHPEAHRVLSRGGGLSGPHHQHQPNRKSTSVDNLLSSRMNHLDDDFDPAPFVRDGVGRRSMSEKKTNVFIDAKQFDFYRGLQLKKSLSDLTGEFYNL
uniref:Pdz domain-containing protein n=1 Tax=Macrostomum lignano TaxID=282301 RepID=A0A1I8FYP2_9PLAT